MPFLTRLKATIWPPKPPAEPVSLERRAREMEEAKDAATAAQRALHEHAGAKPPADAAMDVRVAWRVREAELGLVRAGAGVVALALKLRYLKAARG